MAQRAVGFALLPVSQLVVPAPGHPYAGDAPDAFAHYSEVVRYLEGYGDAIQVPLRCGVDVSSLAQDPATGRFLIGTPECMLEASRVVIATGNVHGVAPGLGTTAARSRPSRALSKLTVHGAVGADERRAIEKSKSLRQS
jgi:hypothetical protein